MTTSNPSTDPPPDDDVSEDYLVTPELGRGPGVLVIHSGRGLTSFVKLLCKRLAREGFVAMAVDLFQGETPASVEDAATAKETLDEAHAERVLEDSAVFLQNHEAVSRPTVGVLGLGYGAEWALKLSSDMSESIGAIVLFYGYQTVDWATIDAPVLGHFAEIDHDLPPSFVDDLREQLAAQGIDTDFFIYSGAEPSFFEEEDTARYSPQAATLAWERTSAFLHRALGKDSQR